MAYICTCNGISETFAKQVLRDSDILQQINTDKKINKAAADLRTLCLSERNMQDKQTCLSAHCLKNEFNTFKAIIEEELLPSPSSQRISVRHIA